MSAPKTEAEWRAQPGPWAHLTKEQTDEFLAAAVANERKWFEAQLVAIKYELSGMALIGVKPMWGSLISRLEQLIADAKARHQ